MINIFRIFVDKIHSDKAVSFNGNEMYEMVIDYTNCSGLKCKNVNVLLTESEHQMIKERGYYLC